MRMTLCKTSNGLGLCILICIIPIFQTQLIVNVKNQKSEVFQEILSANLSEETVHLNVEQPDGTIIAILLDLRHEIQITKVYLLGEEEQREAQFQVICFVTRIERKEFIPIDAMAKLRQKIPWTIRTPERDLGIEVHMMDVILDIRSSDWISPHISYTCAEAKETTYGIEAELEGIVALHSLGANNETSMDKSFEARELYLRTVRPYPLEESHCQSIPTDESPCKCQLDLCIGWYPCALKYCETHDPSGKPVSTYRCGIHTCRKCRKFSYSVSGKFFCL